MIAAAALAVWTQYRTELAEQRRTLLQLSQILAEDTARYMRLVDLVLRDVQPHVAELGIDTADRFRHDLGDAATYAMLCGRERDLPQASTITQIDATGSVVNSSRKVPPPDFNVHDRDYFHYLATHDEPAAYPGDVQQGRASGEPKFFLARRIDGPHGAFLGAVVGVLDVAYLTERYQAILARSGERIALPRDDGMVLARYPDTLSVPADRRMPRDSPWSAADLAGGGT